VATYYEVLGVERSASDDDVRRAYRTRARVLHPDRAGGGGAGNERAMQDLNEAWHVLRDPQRRADYDRRLAGTAPRPGSRPVGWDDDFGQVYGTSHRAEPGDVAASIVRSLPWLGMLFVLGVIFVFTAFASGGGGGDDPQAVPINDLIGRCVQVQRGVGVVPASCAEPNEGQVLAIGARQSHCPRGTRVLPLAGNGPWLCLQPSDDG
jgi:hypothetical protein